MSLRPMTWRTALSAACFSVSSGCFAENRYLLRVGDRVLHVEIDHDDVLVLGQHAHFVGDRTHARRIDRDHFLDRRRPFQIQAVVA